MGHFMQQDSNEEDLMLLDVDQEDIDEKNEKRLNTIILDQEEAETDPDRNMDEMLI